MTKLPNPVGGAAAIALVLTGISSLRGDAPNGNEWYRNNGASVPAGQPVGDFGPSGGPGRQTAPPARASASSDFPDDAVHEWVVASARWGYAKAAVRRAERELDNAIRNAQLNFEQSSDYTQALADEKRAHDLYDTERQKALHDVVNDPHYAAALKLRDELGSQISRVRAEFKNDLPGAVTLTLASQKLRYATDARNLEVAALQKADNVRTAQAKLVEASVKVNALRQAFDNSVRNNPQIEQARKNLEDARLALAGSEAYLNAAHDAAQLATDYSYFRHRYDGMAAPVYGGFGPYAFGY